MSTEKPILQRLYVRSSGREPMGVVTKKGFFSNGARYEVLECGHWIAFYTNGYLHARKRRCRACWRNRLECVALPHMTFHACQFSEPCSDAVKDEEYAARLEKKEGRPP